MDSRYYFEGSHYRPALGLIVEKVLFGTEEETNEIRNEAQDELFGIKVNSDNIDFVISELEKQLQEYKKNNSKL
jgi:predicted nucleotidyltransferase